MAEIFNVVQDSSYPCPVCRGDRFIWGDVRARGAAQTPHSFVADGLSFLGSLSGEGIGEVRSRLCLRCRRLDDFVTDGNFPMG